MRRGNAMHQKSEQLEQLEQLELSELLPRGWGEAPTAKQSGEAGRAADGNERSGSAALLMQQAVSRENAIKAFKRVRRNKGSPGTDGMTVEELEPYLREHWPTLREQLVGGVTSRVQLGELRLIRRYLEAGILADGVVMERREGSTPQGGPLSPLLANVLLDEVDKELERRGHASVRYADDCNVYVQSKRAGEDVLAVLRQQYAKLRLRINEDKSAVAPAWDRKFLGYRFFMTRDGSVKRGVAAQALEELKQRVRQITRRSGGRNIARVAKGLGGYLHGWIAYFRLAETPTIRRSLEGWIHRRLRAIALKQWKRGRATLRALRARGLPEWLAVKGAGHGGRWWWASALGAMHTALPGSYFDRLGVPRLAPQTSTL